MAARSARRKKGRRANASLSGAEGAARPVDPAASRLIRSVLGLRPRVSQTNAPSVRASLGRSARKVRRVSMWLGWIVVAVAVVDLAGWVFAVPLLRSVEPGLANMKVNTALGFVLCGTAIALRSSRDGERRTNRWLALGAGLIGAATLVEYLSGQSLGIDQAFFIDTSRPAFPGRMSPASALSLVLVAAALVSLDRRDGPPAPRRHDWLAVIVGLGSFTALLGYAYDVRALYATSTYASYALNTAFAFAMAACAILCAEPEDSMIRFVTGSGPGAILARRMLPGAIFIPPAFAWLRLLGQRAGLFPPEFGVALFTISSVVSFVGLVVWTAIAISRADEALRLSERGLATTLDSIGDAVIATDTEGAVVRMNPVAEALTGWPFAEARGRPLTEVFHIVNEATRAIVESPVDHVLREGRVVGLANHTALIARDGSERAIADSGAPIRDARGKLTGVVLVFRDQTAEREAERALLASRARKGAVIEAALDSVILMEADGAITEWNPAAERTFGYARAEVIGRTLADLIVPPSLREKHVEGLKRYLETGIGPILGKRIHSTGMRKDGTELPVEITVVRIEGLEPPIFTGYVRDLTQERRASEALRVSEARFQSLERSGVMGIAVADTGGKVSEANDTLLTMLGYTKEDVLTGALSAAFVSPKTIDPVRAKARKELMTKGATLPWEIELRRKDGTKVPVLMAVTMLDPPNCLTIVLDLTEQKRAESELADRTRRLRESEQLLRATLASIREGVIICDETGRVTYQNLYAEQLLGPLSRNPPSAESIRQNGFFLPDGVTPWTEEMSLARRALRGEDSHEVEAFVRNDAAPEGIHISLNGGPIRGPDGAIRGTVLSFRDIGPRKKLEEERARVSQLELVSRKEQEANRLKSEFLANMSHELRTPLNAILGFGELLHDGRVPADSPQHKEFLSDILASGRHLLQLVNSVLDLAKVESGNIELSPAPVELPAVLGEVVAILRTLTAKKRIWLETFVSPELTDIVIDPSKLKQILYNYISNAIKFTPDDGSVSVSILPEGKDELRVEVTDNGPGIAEADIPRLFVEFQQLDSGIAKRVGGTGLGLAVTKGLVTAHGGRVGVRSGIGQGSTFFAVLPRRPKDFAPTPPVPDAAPTPADHVPRVLVIEDDAKDRRGIVEALSRAGYAVETALTGAEALERCSKQHYDAVTLDLLLPDLNGVEVLRAIRSGPMNAGVPVIVITVVTERGVLAGLAVHDMFAKPLRSEALLASFERAGVLAPAHGRVLVVDDDPASLRLMSATLKDLGYRGLCLLRGVDALRAAESEAPLAVILDLQMPEMDGFEFLERFRKLPQCEAVPVIVWTVKDLSLDEAATLRASARTVIQKGAADAALGGIIGELRASLPAYGRHHKPTE